MNIDINVQKLKGPIIVLGASGFLGSNLFRALLRSRDDVFGTIHSGSPWRLADLPPKNIIYFNRNDSVSIESLISKVHPATVFDCTSFGAYSFETDSFKVHDTNFFGLIRLLEKLRSSDLAAYIHAGSSSEYGYNCTAPSELSSLLLPNSHYAVSKVAASSAIYYYGRTVQMPILNLRLYSVYGPYEDSSRLIPALCRAVSENKLPRFAGPNVTRDFIHVDDVVSSFVDAALNVDPTNYGLSFNIGTGIPTTLSQLAEITCKTFNIAYDPIFDHSEARSWDTDNWYADITQARSLFGWQPTTALADGLVLTHAWWKQYLASHDFTGLTKKFSKASSKRSVAAVIACFRDAQAIPVMYERLRDVFIANHLDYEIIFVNDCSPDNTADIILSLSSRDPRVIGITHSRNFGSQAAFRSGMELSSKEAVVLLDGDLQDPPELIPSFIREWRNGADVVYGRRVKRDMHPLQSFLFKSFYRIFSFLSDIPIPKDAGDFSLLDRKVVYWILNCRERDSLIRGLRAYVGFRQVGVDYIRPERAFGVSTNNLIKNIGWAKMAIFSYSRAPLHLVTTVGLILFVFTAIVGVYSFSVWLLAPDLAPRGITFLTFLVLIFGSTTLLSIGVLGEYIGKILEESKSRPPFIRSTITANGMSRPYSEAVVQSQNAL